MIDDCTELMREPIFSLNRYLGSPIRHKLIFPAYISVYPDVSPIILRRDTNSYLESTLMPRKKFQLHLGIIDQKYSKNSAGEDIGMKYLSPRR